MRLSLRLQEGLLAGIGYALLLWNPAWLPASLIHSLLLMLLAWACAERLVPAHRPAFEKLFSGLLLWGSVLSLLFTGAYYASVPLTPVIMGLIEAIAAGIVLFIPFVPPTPEETSEPPLSLVQRTIFLVVSAVGIASFSLLVRTALFHQTTTSIRTPRPLLPNGTFLLFGLLFASGLALTRLIRTAGASWLVALNWLSVSALPALLYPLGYGFDGFIHRASERLLFLTGTLRPKPLYYLGQYVWTIWLSRLTELPIRTIDTWLVPLSVGLVGFSWLLLIRQNPRWMRWAPWIFLLCLPLGAFVTTTPQTWSYLLGVSALLLALRPIGTRREWTLPILLAAWGMVTHPLGGLPFACLVGALWLASFTPSRTLRRVWQGIGGVGALLVLPLAFWAQSHLGNTPINWSLAWLWTIRAQDLLPSLFFSPRQTLLLWLDATEWSGLSLALGTAALSAWLLFRPNAAFDRLLAGTGLGLLVVRFFLERSASFDFLISYERGNYTERLGVLSALLLAIPVARWTAKRIELLQQRSGFLWMTVMLTCVGLWTVRVYDALPRHDAAQASSGWSAGRADHDAVRWIQEQAAGRPYTVLANQTVSAVALEKYGFARCHKEVFYYPLPTGGPLYQLFLEAASTRATTSTLQRAAELTNSDLIYVVLNDYWWDAERVRQQLNGLTSRALSFGEGRVWVYEFIPASTTTATLPTSDE